MTSSAHEVQVRRRLVARVTVTLQAQPAMLAMLEQRTAALAMREGASNKCLSHCTTIDNQYKTCIMCIRSQFIE